jgi:hypothetical protein
MKPLSDLRKALVIVPFVVGAVWLLYGSILGEKLAWDPGLSALLACLVLFGLLVLPYWKSEPGVDPEMSLDG